MRDVAAYVWLEKFRISVHLRLYLHLLCRVTVRDDAADSQVCNTATVSADGFEDTDNDCITIERKAVPKVEAVKVTLPTGPGSIAFVSTALGSLGLAALRLRRYLG